MNQPSPSHQPFLAVVAAACMNNARYAQDTLVPGRPNSKIERMVLAGDCVEVFTSDERHFTLMPPTLLMVMSLATLSDWTLLLKNYGEGQIERIEEVLDITGKTWTLNRGIPIAFDDKGEDVYSDEVSVVSIFSNGAMFEVFAIPKVGSELDQAKYAVKFTLMPLTVQRAIAYAPRQRWDQIIEDVTSDDDEDDDDEVDADEGQHVPPMAAQPNHAPPPQQNILPSLSSVGNLMPQVQAPPSSPETAPNGQSSSGT